MLSWWDEFDVHRCNRQRYQRLIDEPRLPSERKVSENKSKSRVECFMLHRHIIRQDFFLLKFIQKTWKDVLTCQKNHWDEKMSIGDGIEKIWREIQFNSSHWFKIIEMIRLYVQQLSNYSRACCCSLSICFSLVLWKYSWHFIAQVQLNGH